MGHQLHALVAGIAFAQHGIVTHEQLLRAGLTPRRIASWVRHGRLIRVHRGAAEAKRFRALMA